MHNDVPIGAFTPRHSRAGRRTYMAVWLPEPFRPSLWRGARGGGGGILAHLPSGENRVFPSNVKAVRGPPRALGAIGTLHNIVPVLY